MTLRTALPALALAVLLLAACTPAPRHAEGDDLAAARAQFSTRLLRTERDGTPVPAPEGDALERVRYRAPGGDCAAYLSPRPATPERRPAIIWMTGGDSNTLGDVWSPQPRSNDQTAAAFRRAGIVTFYPSLRGGNDNPGAREAFYGEVEDIRAAADYLAGLDYVDPQRIYLGGHSTGGTLVLLTAQIDPRFRAVFAFGPVADVSDYGETMLPVSLDDPQEIRLRSPGYWLASIRSPTFVFEGDHDANTADLQLMRARNRNPKAAFFIVPGTDHFSVLAPTNELIAAKILADTGARSNIAFSEDELARLAH